MLWMPRTWLHASKLANRKEKSKGKALHIALNEEYDEEVFEPDSPTSDSGKLVAFIALSNTSSVQESKSDDDLDINEFTDEE